MQSIFLIADTCKTVSSTSSWLRADILALIGIGVAILVAVIIGLVNFSGSFSSVKTKLDGVQSDVNDLKSKFDRVITLEVNVKWLMTGNVAKSQSPLQLNENGLKILNSSHIQDIIEPYLNEVFETVKKNKPENILEAQSQIFESFKSLKEKTEIKNKVAEAAFYSGADVDTVLLVAGIHNRDSILLKLGYVSKDIDNVKPT